MTTKCFVDTSIFILITNPQSALFDQATEVLNSIYTKKYILVTNLFVINELHYNLCKLYGNKHGNEKFLNSLDTLKPTIVDFSSASFSPKKLINVCAKYHLKTTDAFHYLTCLHHKIKYIATLDEDFAHLRGLEMI